MGRVTLIPASLFALNKRHHCAVNSWVSKGHKAWQAQGMVVKCVQSIRSLYAPVLEGCVLQHTAETASPREVH